MIRRVLVRALPLFLVTGLLWCSPGFAQLGESGDKSLSPYFFVKSDDPTLDQLPLKSTSADVKIAGVIADVLVAQTYKNEGKRPIEAVYVFPGSTRAAVYGMKMTIADRTIVAKINKKEEARRQYEQAKKEGKSASLLEQERPNVFTMNVANILPGDEIKVEMSYTELLVPTNGEYEFSYPCVVGPRYSNQEPSRKPDSPKWAANPYLPEGAAPKTTFDMKVTLSAGLPIQEADVSSHKVSIKYEGVSTAKIALDESEKYGGNRDFILKYRLAGGKIESGLLLSQDDKENFFLLMVQPPKSVKPEQIPPREYIFIVDVSGSMNGFPLNTAKAVLKNLISNLKPTDTFNILLFSGGSTLMSEQSIPATEENLQKAVNVIDREQGGGGTELLPALKKALELPKKDSSSRSFVVVTDGYVTVENEAFDLIRQNLNKANLFAFGIGSSVNRFIIEGMAKAGMGEPLIITKPDEAAGKGEKFRNYIQSPVLTGINVDFGAFEVKSVEPPTVPDVLAERPVIIFGKWKGKPEGTIALTGASGEGEYKQTFDVGAVKPLPENSALRYMWARHRIAMLSDYNTQRNSPEMVAEITQLGLDYNLLTAFTSFVAIDSLARLKNGEHATAVNQALPLPDGVSNLAVGGAMNAPMAMSKSMQTFSEDREEGGDADGLSFNGPAQERSRGAPPSKPGFPLIAKAPPKPLEPIVSNKITVGGIISSGGLPSDEIRKVFEANMSLLKTEYDKALRSNPGLHGKIGYEFTIDASGKVSRLKIFSDEINYIRFSEAITRELQKFTFPAPKSGKAEFTITITFES